MSALGLFLSLPFRLVAAIAGALTVVIGSLAVAFLVVGLGFQAIGETIGGDR